MDKQTLIETMIVENADLVAEIKASDAQQSEVMSADEALAWLRSL